MIGFHSDMLWLPEHGVGAVILTQRRSRLDRPQRLPQKAARGAVRRQAERPKGKSLRSREAFFAGMAAERQVAGRSRPTARPWMALAPRLRQRRGG
jgi:hypothetical protein